MTANLSARLGFLTDAAHLLAKTAPETSAYLMSCRTGLMARNDVPLPEAQRQHLCTSCGHILIPGQQDAIRYETQKALRVKKKRQKTAKDARPPRQEAGGQGPRRIISCGTCGVDTIIKMSAPDPISRKPLKVVAATSVPEQKPATANASSKKRAKSRKAGLVALLQNQATASTTRPSLSLADFMKKD